MSQNKNVNSETQVIIPVQGRTALLKLIKFHG